MHRTWPKSCSGGSGVRRKVVGGSGRIQAPDPLALNCLWRTDPAALPPSSTAGSSPSPPAANRPRGSDFTQQQRQHSKERKSCLASLPVDDVIS